ncbi:hypothetical protein [Streptomyces sp. NRRL S-495]|uniref:hypothetical protein n=1 Tax=Streptomyces sp. NRRL S-495 TaxID=1609133 RepID=UPI0005F97067|nr:hypothetical protein [Streptomyces sp. NRRL S-495]KJY28166.1 hypothetical protein VR45_33065 [Streptomyces sp. NRRL S-495]
MVSRAEADTAAQLCIDLVSGGGSDAIASQALRYTSESTWNALLEQQRGRGCESLSRLARALLDGKKSLHGMVGAVIGRLWAALGRPRIEQVFARELATRMPLPFGHEVAAAARGLQATGILICLTGGGPMQDCACLKDLLVNEGRAQFENLLHGAFDDWINLPSRMHDPVALPGATSI